MGISLSDEIRQLLDRANFAHLATLMPDGSPQSVPVWIGRDGDRIIVCTGENSLKAKNTRRDPRVALSIVDFDNPYVEAQIRGRVVERRTSCRAPARSRPQSDGSNLPQVRGETFSLPKSRSPCGADH